jgi:hypothetical protein
MTYRSGYNVWVLLRNKMTDNPEIPSKDEILKNMAKHLQTNMQDGEEVLLRTYDLAFIKGKMAGLAEAKSKSSEVS